MLGDSVMLLVFSIWVKTLTGSSAMAGLTFFFMVVPAMLAPLLGLWVDRIPRQAVLVWGNAASACVLVPLVLVRDAGGVWLIWTVAFLYGVSSVVLPAALNGLLKDVMPDELLLDANAVLQTTKEGYRLIGPLLGAAMFAVLGGWSVALLDAATFAVAAVVIAGIRVEEKAIDADEAAFRDRLLAGVRFLATDGVLKHVLVGFGCMLLVIGFLEASAYALLDEFGRPATFAGVLVSVQGLGAILGGLFSSRVVRRTGEVRCIVVGLSLLATSLAVAALAPTMGVVLIAMVGCGLGLPLTFVPFLTLVQRRSPHHLVGRVSAVIEVVMATPQALSLAVGAALVSLIDYRLIFWATAAVIGASAAYICIRLLGVAEEGQVQPASRALRVGRGHEHHQGRDRAVEGDELRADLSSTSTRRRATGDDQATGP